MARNTYLKSRFRAAVRLFAVLISALLVTTGCAHRNDLLHSVSVAKRKGQFKVEPGKRVAVLTFSGSNGVALSELISIELLSRGVDVVERDSLDRIVREIQRTKAGMFDDSLPEAEIVKRLGKVANADIVVYGDSSGVTPNTIRLTDTEGAGTYGAGLTVLILSLSAMLVPGLALVAILPEAGGPLIGTGVLGAAIGGGLMSGGNPAQDFGDRSPYFTFASNSVAVRAFSTKTGEILWWGNFDVYTQAPDGDHVRLMDHLRATAKSAVMALMDPSFGERQVRAEDDDIPVAFETVF